MKNVVWSKKSVIWKMPKDEFSELVKNSDSLTQIVKAFQISTCDGSINTVRRRIEEEGIDRSHIPVTNKGRKHLSARIPVFDMMTENSTCDKGALKRKLIEEEVLEYKCSECGNGDMWNGKLLVLQLDHINGINNDNRLHNLRFLCPNCHTQTPNWGNKGNRRVKGENKRKERRREKKLKGA